MEKLILANYQQYKQPILKIRETVFVVEQKVPPELEVDELDPFSQHVLLFDNNIPVATGRLTPDGHIGRIAVLREFRGRGFGNRVMQSLEATAKEAGLTRVVLGAQNQAIPFYEKLGYTPFGDIFMDAGIEHRMMEKRLNNCAE